jgi:hypothetical protein
VNRRGGALLATIIISMLLLSVSVWYLSWSGSQSKETTHARATQRAQEYAESALEAAQAQLMAPTTAEITNPEQISGDTEHGRYEYALSPSSATPGQMDVVATGYSYFPQGSEEDGVTHRRAQRAVIHAEYFVDRIDKLMVAVPGALRIHPGTTAMGAIYASDLVFVKGSENETTQIGGAAFSHSIARDDGTEDPSPPYVVFLTTAQRLGFPIRFPELSATVRAFYQSYATSGASLLEDGASLDGLVDAPSNPDVPVYFCKGDLHLSRSRIFIPKNLVIVYVAGVLHIHNAVMAEGGWAVFLVEKGIQIENDTPNDLALNGTFVTNGAIISLPQHRKGDLSVNGSLVAGEGIDLAVGWDGHRTYAYRPAPPMLPLPHLMERMTYELVQGKYK